MKAFSLRGLSVLAFLLAACGGISSLGSGSGSDGIHTDDRDDDGRAPGVPFEPCAGKPCGALCEGCPPGEVCTDVARYCGADGKCGEGFPVCEVSLCDSHADCPVPEVACQLCSDGTYACPSASCVAGRCVSSFDSCPDSTCLSDADCPTSNAPCQLCGDGSQVCPIASCQGGRCVASIPGCSGHSPCAGKACGEPCSQCPPHDPDCFETAVLKTCDANGVCTPGQVQCGGSQCRFDHDCPAIEICKPCPNGECASVGCIDGTCGFRCDSNPEPECRTTDDCDPHILICQECPNGRCAEMDCVSGQCRFVCK